MVKAAPQIARCRTWERAQIVARFESVARSVSTADQLSKLLQEVTIELGFQHFALLHHASLIRPSSKMIRIDNYPPAWEAELAAKGRLQRDPVHQASLRASTGFCWSDLGQFIELSDAQLATMTSAQYFGLESGFTVPVNVPGEPNGSCSFASRGTHNQSKAALRCVQSVAQIAFASARRIQGFTSRAARTHLSRRERECVVLVAAGKTDWEIAVILGLSPETVHQYVKRARAAFDVVSRSQLIVLALRDGVLSYDDALDL